VDGNGIAKISVLEVGCRPPEWREKDLVRIEEAFTVKRERQAGNGVGWTGEAGIDLFYSSAIRNLVFARIL
jgi:hypothetical protein